QATVLPSVRADLGALRTTDPVAVFGLKLRQRELTAADFAPGTLVRPAARSAVATGLVLEVPLWSPDARWARRAAGAGAAAADAAAVWTRATTRADVARAWTGALAAREQAQALDSALLAARAGVAQAGAFLRAGTATRADVLLAEVRVGELEAALAAAHEQQRLARLGLALAMGAPGDTLAPLPAVLPATAALQRALTAAAQEAAPAATGRADVQAAARQADAAAAARALAARHLVPRVGAMARQEWNTPDRPVAGVPFTTAGIMLQWTLFGGGADIGGRRAAAARADAAQAMADAARAAADLDVSRARGALGLAAERLALAERGAAQALEAERLVRRRYDGGLATIAELLAAGATRTQAQVTLAATRLAALDALITHRTATGRDLAPVAALVR
nr:TolC family protein [Gemmatimonadaceae bacterium]